MGSKFAFFLIGVATGVAVMALAGRSEKDKETEDFEAVADTLQKRFERLEAEFSSTGG